MKEKILQALGWVAVISYGVAAIWLYVYVMITP